MSEFNIPTEEVNLPSKGLLYPETSLLSKGVIEMKYMTAKEEDILTNINYLKNGTAIDKLLQALIVTPINFDELIAGDKNAIMIAARILGYGEKYTFKFEDRSYEVDLTKVKEKELDLTKFKGKNEFDFTLPQSQNLITFKILTSGDEKKIEAELKGLKKIFPEVSFDNTTRLKYTIVAVNGDRERVSINEFVDKALTARDARELRAYYNKIQPDIDLKYYPEEGSYAEEGIAIPINVTFFWPDISG